MISNVSNVMNPLLTLHLDSSHSTHSCDTFAHANVTNVSHASNQKVNLATDSRHLPLRSFVIFACTNVSNVSNVSNKNGKLPADLRHPTQSPNSQFECIECVERLESKC